MSRMNKKRGPQREKEVLARGESVSIRPDMPLTIMYEILASVGEQNNGQSIIVGHETCRLDIMTTQDDIGRIQFSGSSKNCPELNSPLLLTLFS